jgi:hypothetical protein
MLDYEFITPRQWQLVQKPDHVLLTQSPDEQGCVIQILPPQPSSGDLERDAGAVFDMMYGGWRYSLSGERQFALAKGFLPSGLAYSLKEATMNVTAADGRYLVEDGVALVINAGRNVVIVAVRHRGTLAHADCLNRYDTLRRFFNTFAVKGAPVAAAGRSDRDSSARLVGVWAQSGSRAQSEYAFAANGHYAFSGRARTPSRAMAAIRFSATSSRSPDIAAGRSRRGSGLSRSATAALVGKTGSGCLNGTAQGS